MFTSLFQREAHEVVLQSEAAECGLACVANILAFHGQKIPIRILRQKFPISVKGTNLKSLIDIAGQMDLNCRALRVELEDFSDLRMPAILHWQMSHFVVIEKITERLGKKKIHLIDPASGRLVLDPATFNRMFTGIVLELERSVAFVESDLSEHVSLTALLRNVPGMFTSLWMLGVTALFAQMAASIVPFTLQIAIDVIAPSGDTNLLVTMTAIFVSSAVAFGFMSWLRSRISSSLANVSAFQMSANIVRHLMGLSLDWFQKRQTADIISRVSSLNQLALALTTQCVPSVIAAVSVATNVIILAFYSLFISVSSSIIVGVIICARLAVKKKINRLAKIRAQAEAVETGLLLENLESVRAIKAFAIERLRTNRWMDARSQTLRCSERVSRIEDIMAGLPPVALLSFATLVAMFVAERILAGTMTIGQAAATFAFSQQALIGGLALAEGISNFQGLRVHLERISDIALEERVSVDARPVHIPSPKVISIRNISFRYGISEDFILNDVSFDVRSGESIAIVGRSGGGKSTLLSIIAGLIEPSGGEIRIDGLKLSRGSHSGWRSNVGYVAQEERLFKGSLAENISLFDEGIDMNAVRQAARDAIIDEDIMRMPMRYDTLVGDMGSSLSGGQKARVLVARALYRKPAILLIDEGTAHLDTHTEGMLNASLKSIGITKIVVAHRPETIASADRVLRLCDGIIYELADSERRATEMVAPGLRADRSAHDQI